MYYLDTFTPGLRIYRADLKDREIVVTSPIGSLFDEASFTVPANETLFIPSMGCVTPIETVDIFGSNVPRRTFTIRSRSNTLSCFGLLLAEGSRVAQRAVLNIFDEFDATEMDISYIEKSIVPSIKYKGPDKYCRWTIVLNGEQPAT